MYGRCKLRKKLISVALALMLGVQSLSSFPMNVFADDSGGSPVGTARVTQAKTQLSPSSPQQETSGSTVAFGPIFVSPYQYPPQPLFPPPAPVPPQPLIPPPAPVPPQPLFPPPGTVLPQPLIPPPAPVPPQPLFPPHPAPVPGLGSSSFAGPSLSNCDILRLFYDARFDSSFGLGAAAEQHSGFARILRLLHDAGYGAVSYQNLGLILKLLYGAETGMIKSEYDKGFSALIEEERVKPHSGFARILRLLHDAGPGAVSYQNLGLILELLHGAGPGFIPASHQSRPSTFPKVPDVSKTEINFDKESVRPPKEESVNKMAEAAELLKNQKEDVFNKQ